MFVWVVSLFGLQSVEKCVENTFGKVNQRLRMRFQGSTFQGREYTLFGLQNVEKCVTGSAFGYNFGNVGSSFPNGKSSFDKFATILVNIAIHFKHRSFTVIQ